MAFVIRTKSQFRKDLKKAATNPRYKKGLPILKTLIDEHLIETGNQYKPHPLMGNWKPHWECHVLPDFLLIWRVDTENNEIILARLGSHSELF